MKKTIFILTVLSCLTSVSKAQFYVWNENSVTYGNDVSCIDSILFQTGMEFWKNNSSVYRCNTSEVDSITFSTGNMYVSLADFAIGFDDSEKEIYGLSYNENIPSDVSDTYYEDFLENMNFDQTLTIIYDGETAKSENTVEGATVTVNGAHVTVNSAEENVKYILKGTTDNGSFKVYSNSNVAIVLDNTYITNPAGAAINVQSAANTYIEMPENTENTLSDGETYNIPENESMKSCIYSLGKLIFSGKGKLDVNASYKHGISNDENYIRLRSGCQITINSVNDGIHAAEDIIVDGGCIEIDSEGDGAQADKGNIYVNGGFIKIKTNGEKAHGLKTDADIFFRDGAIQCTVSGPASKGLSGDGNITVENGCITLVTQADPIYEDNDLSSCAGIKCDGDFTMNGGRISVSSTGNGGKGINCDGKITMNSGLIKAMTTGKQYIYGSLDTSSKAIKAEKNIVVNGGTILARASGGEGSEGIESKDSIIINNGTVVSKCYDDAMNASNNITINGGYLYNYSNGNDAIDSNGTINVNGGITLASGAREPEGGIDCDQSTFTVTGGILIGIGGTTSTPTANVSTQNTIVYNGARNVTEYINIQKDDGTNVLTFRVPQEYSSMTLLFTAPDIELNQKYNIYTSGSISGGIETFGIFTGCKYSGGTLMTSLTTNSRVTTTGSSSGPGGGGPGGDRPRF